MIVIYMLICALLIQNENRSLHEKDTRHKDKTCRQVSVRYKNTDHFLTKLRLKMRDACSKKELSLKFVFVSGKRIRPEGEMTGEM